MEVCTIKRNTGEKDTEIRIFHGQMRLTKIHKMDYFVKSF